MIYMGVSIVVNSKLNMCQLYNNNKWVCSWMIQKIYHHDDNSVINEWIF